MKAEYTLLYGTPVVWLDEETSVRGKRPPNFTAEVDVKSITELATVAYKAFLETHSDSSMIPAENVNFNLLLSANLKEN